MTIGKRLRELRQSRGYSLRELSIKTGGCCEKAYLSGIENGKVNPPSPRVIRKLAKALCHDVRELLLMAYIEKAPEEIRRQVRKALAISAA